MRRQDPPAADHSCVLAAATIFSPVTASYIAISARLMLSGPPALFTAMTMTRFFSGK